MGLIYNLLIGIIHLLFVAFDILFVMILIRVVYQRWKPPWLKQAANTVEPLIVSVMRFVYRAVRRITGRSLPEEHLVLMVIVSMWITRFVIGGLFNSG